MLWKLSKWACGLFSCIACGALFSVSGTLGEAARRHQSVGRVLYLVLLFVGCLLGWIMLNLPGWLDSAHYLSSLPSFAGCHNATGTALPAVSNTVSEAQSALEWLLAHEFNMVALSVPERLCFGHLSVHRITLAFCILHGLLMVLTVGLKHSNDARYDLQHSWWALKLVLLVFLLVFAFVALPNEGVIIYSWIAFVGAILFVVVQIYFVIEFAHRFNAQMRENYAAAVTEGVRGRCFTSVGLLLFTAAAYGMTIAFFVLSYIDIHGRGGTCGVPLGIVTTALVLLVLVSIWAARAWRLSRAGLLPALIVSLYAAYMVWAALTPGSLDDMGCTLTASTHEQQLQTTTGNQTVLELSLGSIGLLHEVSQHGQQFLLLGMAIFSILYATIRTSDDLSERGLDDNDALDDIEMEMTPTEAAPSGGSATGATRVMYSASLFHLVFILAYMYTSMVLTGWTQVSTLAQDAALAEAAKHTIYVNQTTMSFVIKVSAAAVALLLYVWTVISPRCCGKE